MALQRDQDIRDMAVRIVSAYINQDALAEEDLPPHVCKALAALRRSVERLLDAP